MLSQEANYTAAFMVREKINHFCPLLDAILMMLWHDMANVEIYVSQDFKKELLYLKKKKKKKKDPHWICYVHICLHFVTPGVINDMILTVSFVYLVHC